MSRQTELMAISESKTSKRYRFYLQNPSQGLLLLRYAPSGWESAKFKIERNTKYYGMMRSMTVNELTFVKDARDYIQSVYEGQGINANITFTVQRYKDTTQAYVDYFIGKVDLSTYRIEETGVKVGIIDNTITEKVKNRENQKVDLRKLESIEGFEIPPFTNEDGRIEFPDYNIVGNAVWVLDTTDDDSTDNDHYCPMLLTTSEFTEAQSQTITGTDPMFLSSTADRSMTVSGRIQGLVTWGVELPHVMFRIFLYVNGSIVKTWTFTGSWTNEITFDTGIISEAVAVTTGKDISLRGSAIDYGETITTRYQELNIVLNQVIQAVTGYSNIALPFYEALLRTLQLITDTDDCLQCTYFGRTDTPVVTYASDGQFGHLMRGLYIRNAIGLNDTIPVSLNELFGSLSAIFMLGMGVDEVSGTDKVVIESLSYFFNANVVCDLSGKLREEAISKEVLPEWHYSGIKVGYNSFEYKNDDNQGTLAEFNTKSEFTTVISSLENSLDLVTKYRADTMGIINLRVAGNISDNVKGDEDIFLVDSVRKVLSPFWLARTDEDFTLVSGGIDADQSYNLDFSPKRNLLRHGIMIRPGLEHYLNTYLRWQTSDKNTTLKTQKTAEATAVTENEDVLVNDLDEPMWWPEAYDVELDFDDDDLQSILVNPRGLVKLSQTKFGWILSLEAGSKEKKAQLRLLRCNTNYVTPIES